MQKRILGILVLVLILLLPHSTEARSVSQVYLVPVHGAIEPGLAEFITRAIQDAEKNQAAVLLEINTFGGRVDAATEIRDLIVKSTVPVVSYVISRAWSAGALITLAAPYVAMAPGSSIGAAEPRPAEEKTISALRAEFESTAERVGRNPLIAGAMVDSDIAIEGVVEEGKILTLSAVLAQEYGFAEVIATSREEVLEFFNLGHLPVVEYSPNWAERLARLITEPTISSLLLTVGFLGLLYEITTVGWGVPGTAGLLALMLFFGGRLVVGLAGLEVVLMFGVGLLLLLVEIFALPGFGLAGAVGIVSMLSGIILAFGDLYSATLSLLISLTSSVVFVFLFWNRFTNSKAWQRLVLSHREERQLGYTGIKDYSHLLGKEGLTVTDLRPAGICSIDSERYDVVSEGAFMSANVKVTVVMIEGTRVVVRPLSE